MEKRRKKDFVPGHAVVVAGDPENRWARANTHTYTHARTHHTHTRAHALALHSRMPLAT